MERKRNPKEQANFLSLITFFYNYKVLKCGTKCDLEDDDLYRVVRGFEAGSLGNKLEIQWEFNRKSGRKFWSTLLRCFGFTYLGYAVTQLLFTTTVVVCQSIVLSKFVAQFDKNNNVESSTALYTCAYAIMFGSLGLISVFFTHNLAFLLVEYSLKIRTAISSLIFRKSLRISPAAFSEITIGRTITLLSKDVFALDGAVNFVKDLVISLIQVVVLIYVLYSRVDMTAFLSISVVLSVIIIQLLCGKIASKVRLTTSKTTDERFRLTQEVVTSIKTMKTSSWISYFQNLIDSARFTEMNKLLVVYYLKAIISWLGELTPSIGFNVILLFHIIQGQALSIETIYFIQQCFRALETGLTESIPSGISNLAELMAALKRIQAFLDADETPQQSLESRAPMVYLNKAKVVIDKKEILSSVSIALEDGLALVAGHFGSGKTALLKTIIGEYPVVSGDREVHGTISYAPQEPWIFPGTIKENILFGEPYIMQRYRKVLNACALNQDLRTLPQSDETVMGDNGINISKGFQAKISLARAVYKKSHIYLIDNCFSLLDNTVSNYILKRCIKEFLKDNLCILVTDNMNVISETSNGKILFLELGSTSTLEEQNSGLDRRITYYIDEETNAYCKEPVRKSILIYENKAFIAEDMEEHEEPMILVRSKMSARSYNSERAYKETNKTGKVMWENYTTYWKMVGGILALFYLCTIFAVSQVSISLSHKILSNWINLEPKVSVYAGQNVTENSDYERLVHARTFNLHLYALLLVVAIITMLLRSLAAFYVGTNAARNLHGSLLKAIVHTSMTFFERNFIGNIINRLSKDMYLIDETLPYLVFDSFKIFFSLIGVLVLTASISWMLLFAGAFLTLKFYFLLRLYLPTGRSLRRLEASNRSSIMGFLNSSLAGITIIRACKKEGVIRNVFDHHQDSYTSAYYMNQATLRLFLFLLDFCTAMYTFGVLFKFIIFFEGEGAGDVGLALTQAIVLSSTLQFAFKTIAEVETAMTSVERVLDYSKAAESESTADRVVEDWPEFGDITFDRVSLTYGENTVLKNLSFRIPGSSTIGIIGPTGCGKSSLVTLLIKLRDFDGNILIDGEDIKQLSLDFLRSSITVISQDPVLFSGTIRTNIDPYYNYSDNAIWKALEKVHVKELITDLNQKIDYCKSAFSSGEKQLLCLARALVQNNKIVVLDEATATVDAKTANIIHKTIRKCFSDCTVIIVAHRMQTVIWCDRVMTLQNGSIIEFDDPRELLKDSNNYLFKMLTEENVETFLRLTHI